ncbi:hypothetical protein DFH09DRAFT_1301786 [Mycena vulgaris]|nr:hypothetical protein DFH09DRAFT_1301786 [Mycena vulgaris]
MTAPILPAPPLEDVVAWLRRAVSPLALVLAPRPVAPSGLHPAARAQLLITFFLSSTPPPHLSALPPPAALFDSNSLPPGSPGRSRASSTPVTSRSLRERHHAELPAPECYVPRQIGAGLVALLARTTKRSAARGVLRVLEHAGSMATDVICRKTGTSRHYIFRDANGTRRSPPGQRPMPEPTWLCIAPASRAVSVALTIPTPRPQPPTSRREPRLRYDAHPIVSKRSQWTWGGALRISFTLVKKRATVVNPGSFQ